MCIVIDVINFAWYLRKLDSVANHRERSARELRGERRERVHLFERLTIEIELDPSGIVHGD